MKKQEKNFLDTELPDWLSYCIIFFFFFVFYKMAGYELAMIFILTVILVRVFNVRKLISMKGGLKNE